MNKSTECPNCENKFPKSASDNSFYCPECGKEWNVELPSLDDQILDHAEKIIELMKLKGFKDDSLATGTTSIDIRLWHDGIEVEASLQDIKTIRRKKA